MYIQCVKKFDYEYTLILYTQCTILHVRFSFYQLGPKWFSNCVEIRNSDKS